MSDPLIWAIVLMALGFGLLFAEAFIPSGGLIGFLAIGFLGLSIWNAFNASTTFGLWFVIGILILSPIMVGLALSIWPKTPMGRRVMLAPPEKDEAETEIHGPRQERLIGQIGKTLTPLRPSGMIDFEGKRVDGMSEEGLIPTGTLVRAMQIRNGQVIVQVATGASLEDLLSDQETKKPQVQPPPPPKSRFEADDFDAVFDPKAGASS